MRRDLLLVGLFTAVFLGVTAALAVGGALIELDLTVRAWSEEHRTAAPEQVGRILNRLGQGGALLLVCAALAGWLALRRWRLGASRWTVAAPPLFTAVAFLLVYGLVATAKAIFTRGAPSCVGLAAEYTVELQGALVCPDGYADAYPSGHAVNVIVWYGLLVLLVTELLRAYGRGGLPPAARWALRVVPVVVVITAQTYLSFHWVSDSVAGLALGLAIEWTLRLLRRHYRNRRALPAEI